MNKVTKKDRWVEVVYNALLQGTPPLRELRKQMYADKVNGSRINRIITEAKEKIKTDANDVKDITYDLNLLRLTDIADNTPQPPDQLSAIDKLNKMVGAYTTNINIAENVRFILGDEEAFENNFTEVEEGDKTE